MIFCTIQRHPMITRILIKHIKTYIIIYYVLNYSIIRKKSCTEFFFFRKPHIMNVGLTVIVNVTSQGLLVFAV